MSPMPCLPPSRAFLGAVIMAGVLACPATAQELDRLVDEAIGRQGLAVNGPADRATWLRRVSFDLVGLPPTPEEVDAFVADPAADRKACVVDRLLASPRYGERWAAWWLDLARYADSQGYEKDALRGSMWRYRNWVIEALQSDMPFDRFTIEQLAGDLLPAASTEQQLATAFHRQTMTNTEGGTDDEEFRTAAVIDRVDTTMSVWMAATAGCAQCHDHKYDPIRQREFYGIYAFFDQTEDSDRGDDAPTLRVPTSAQRARQKALELELTTLRAKLQVDPATVMAWAGQRRAAWLRLEAANVTKTPWQRLAPISADSFQLAHETAFAPEREVLLDQEQEGLRWQPMPDYRDGEVHTWRGDNSAFYLYRKLHADAAAGAVLSLGSDDAIKVWWNGEPILARKVSRGAAADQELLAVELRPGDNELLLKITNGGGIGGFYFDLRATDLGRDSEQLVVKTGEARDDAGSSRLREIYLQRAPELADLRVAIAAAEAAFDASAGPAVPVMRELPADRRRTTHVLLRGSFLLPGETVEPHTPACWPPLPEDAPNNRLGFARWLVSPDNPRTSRVIANRIWAELFGRGLVETLEDFGSQGEPCSHPELLDWLGDEFVRGAWSLKHLLRTIVLSEAYGRDSSITAAALEQDPYNIWLARGPAFRLSAEMLRDQALAVSGLLHEQIGGPSVMPPQPDGIWMQIYSGARWQEATGPDRYRRALYTFWRRTSPHPAMMVLDAQSREFCVLRRTRTNTPLQALVLWNDPQFTEAAAALADQVMAAKGDDEARVCRLLRRCMLRAPTAVETARLLALLAAERASGADEAMAWNVLAGVVMNLDEFVTKR
ncbi:MAG: DUF1553 domain-containing protein [Planctomycetes bacterium]|nr:DUF1553 domain-containing protein [Planctomycetota bacterium]